MKKFKLKGKKSIRVKEAEPTQKKTALSYWNYEKRDDMALFVAGPTGPKNASVLVLTPVPSPEDYQNSCNFADEPARIFRRMLQEQIGLDLNDCLVCPCVREGTKALKGNTRDVMEWVQRCVERKLFRLIICIGGDAAKWIINGGKKANIAGLAGQVMYPKSINHTPLFLFPDVKGVIPEPHPDRREMYFREQAAENHLKRLAQIATLLAQGVKELIPQ